MDMTTVTGLLKRPMIPVPESCAQKHGTVSYSLQNIKFALQNLFLIHYRTFHFFEYFQEK